MTDDEIIKIQQTVARTLASLVDESYIGSPLTRERLEAAASKAMGFPVRFPDYDEKTGKATEVVVIPPVKLNHTDGNLEQGERPMPRKNYTPAERALHILGTLAGKSRQEINDAIGSGDNKKMVPVERRKEIPQGSLDMLKKRYAPALGLLGQPTAILLWEHCVAPKKAGDL